MSKDTVVSEEFAKKFASEKETPYTRWIRSEGLDIIGAHYEPNLRVVERQGIVGHRAPVVGCEDAVTADADAGERIFTGHPQRNRPVTAAIPQLGKTGAS